MHQRGVESMIIKSWKRDWTNSSGHTHYLQIITMDRGTVSEVWKRVYDDTDAIPEDQPSQRKRTMPRTLKR